MTAWNPIIVLANLRLQRAIECDLAAFAPPNDERVQEIIKNKKVLGDFLSRFTDSFGRATEPVLLLLRDDAPDSFRTHEAIAGLRDALSISVIPLSRAHQLKRGGGRSFGWSNYFAFYPWMIAKDDSGLIGSTPALLGFDDFDDFAGQSSPEIFVESLSSADIDKPLFSKLVEKWKGRFADAKPKPSDIALFRSLNMAFNASAIPSRASLYDVGRLVALWVSAFEILAHPGEEGQVKLSLVYDLLKNSPWTLKASEAEEHKCYIGKKEIISINACWLYGLLYQARNNFLHGNPVSGDNLQLPAGRNLFEIASPLYRMALASALPLVPPESKGELETGLVVQWMAFNLPQKPIEQALLDAHKEPVE